MSNKHNINKTKT